MAEEPTLSLPEEWLVESTLSAADGATDAGDLVVAATRDDGTGLDLVLVDVSGHGAAAAAQAAELGLLLRDVLARVEPAEVLATTNAELHARDWSEAFATAIHVSLDLRSGDYRLWGAGHPPPVRRKASSGRWRLLACPGPVLGLLPEASYDAVSGSLDPGDALLLYTDGMVEQPRRDLERGIVGMVRAAEDATREGFDGLTERLVAAVGRDGDDRTLVLVHRR